MRVQSMTQASEVVRKKSRVSRQGLLLRARWGAACALALGAGVPAVYAQETVAPSTSAATGGESEGDFYSAPVSSGMQGSGKAVDVNAHLPSSSQPRLDGSADSFDLRRGGAGPVILQGSGEEGAYEPGTEGPLQLGKARKQAPEFHVVQKGDTLWKISERYFQNPWEWPRVWSLNPQVENPHWIYPGDQLRTARPTASSLSAALDDNSAGGGGLIGRERTVSSGTLFLRDQGYIGDPERDVWGELVGAREEKMMLSDQDTVYLLMKEEKDVRIGQRLTIFREVRSPDAVAGARKPPGELVKVYGTVRIDAWDPETRIAKGKVIESLDVIERGSSVGPVGRRFDIVPPKQATVDLEARILTSVYPHIYFGQNQIVFIDKGSEDGLVPGNRLRAVRHGDTWRRELKSASTHARLRVPLDSPAEAPAEATPLRGDDELFPDEVAGEITVLRTEQYSAICLVTASNRPLVVGERVLAASGY